MKRTMGLVAACLLGGLMVFVLITGLDVAVQAAEPAAPRAPTASPGDVVINEVVYDPTSSPSESSYEWLELYNNTGTVITLTGWVISDNNTSDVLPTAVISPHDLIIVAANALSFSQDYPGYAGVIINLNGSIGNGLSNSGDRVELHEGATLIDALSYGSDSTYFTLPDVDEGHSLERKPVGVDTDTAGDWIDQSTPTPGQGLVPAADVGVAKAGPPTADPGDLLTYTLQVSNTGAVPATGVVLTDVLPAAIDFVTQTSPFTFSNMGRTLIWDLGRVPTATGRLITLTARVTGTASGRFTNRISATTTASETVTGNNADEWETAIVPHVYLYALAPASYGGSREAIALINLDTYTVSLDSWWVNDRPEVDGVSFPPTATIAPEQIIWLAQDADAFAPVWGFDPDWAAQPAITHVVPVLGGSWDTYFFSDAGEEACLLDADGNVVDTLVYGTGLTTTAGWSGPAVPYKYPGYGDGQVLYRKLDQGTGRPVADTGTAADWAQNGDDPIDGRKLRYPGWDLEDLFFPAEIAASATVTLAAAPEGALAVVTQTIAAAQVTLRLEGYTLESAAVYQAIAERIQAGVVVTLLLESQPNGIEDAEKWIVDQLHDPPTCTVYFIGETTPRYRYQHAKVILADDRLALVSTENFSPNAMPADRKDNGTSGHRGFVAVTDSPGAVARLAEVFARDCDPAHHPDVVAYDGSFSAPAPLPEPDWTTYTAPFVAPLVATADRLTVLHTPEHGLRDTDGLLGLIESAGPGDTVLTMQLNEPYTWTAGAGPVGLNPRLQALLTAGRQGAQVRVLLDAYYDHDGSNAGSCVMLNTVASQESLSLTCHLADVTGLGIHAKVFAAEVGGERWVHVGSINGTETSSKLNREVGLQFRSSAAYDWMATIFDYDWSRSYEPLVHKILLPLVMRQHLSPATYPVISEVFVNPTGDDAGKEWIEIYNPGPDVSIAGWTIGDAINAGDYGDGRYTFPAGAQVVRGQVIVAAACATDFSAAYGRNPDYEWTDCDPAVPGLTPAGAWDGFGLAMGNESDEVRLVNGGGAQVDSAAWGGGPRVGVTPFTDFTPPFPSDGALRRYPAGIDRDDCTVDFYVTYTPRPGEVEGN